MVLHGGGDLYLRVWSGFRRYVSSLAGWFRNANTNQPAFRHHIGLLEEFLANEAQHFQHAWNMLSEKKNDTDNVNLEERNPRKIPYGSSTIKVFTSLGKVKNAS